MALRPRRTRGRSWESSQPASLPSADSSRVSGGESQHGMTDRLSGSCAAMRELVAEDNWSWISRLRFLSLRDTRSSRERRQTPSIAYPNRG